MYSLRDSGLVIVVRAEFCTTSDNGNSPRLPLFPLASGRPRAFGGSVFGPKPALPSRWRPQDQSPAASEGYGCGRFSVRGRLSARLRSSIRTRCRACLALLRHARRDDLGFRRLRHGLADELDHTCGSACHRMSDARPAWTERSRALPLQWPEFRAGSGLRSRKTYSPGGSFAHMIDSYLY
jgi:hypothetical protein